MERPTIIVVLLSAIATAFIWRQIHRSDDPPTMKWMLAIAVAIPVIGPLFGPFLSMPSRHSRSAIFKGPIAPNPRHPKWAAISFRVLTVVIALGAALAHLVFFGGLGK